MGRAAAASFTTLDATARWHDRGGSTARSLAVLRDEIFQSLSFHSISLVHSTQSSHLSHSDSFDPIIASNHRRPATTTSLHPSSTRTMASPTTSAAAGLFPFLSHTRRRNLDLPTLVRKEGEERASGGKPVLPTDEEPVVREGAQAALEGVNKRAYFPPGASRPTALQKHASFWDRNKSGIIYPWNTYTGCRALGFNPLFAITYALAFHLLHTSYWTSDSICLHPLLPIYIERIHRAKHGTWVVDGGSFSFCAVSIRPTNPTPMPAQAPTRAPTTSTAASTPRVSTTFSRATTSMFGCRSVDRWRM